MNLGTPLRKMIKLLCKFIFQPLYYINPLLNTINLHIIPWTCKFLILWNALHSLVSSGACSLFFAHLIMLFQGLIQFLLSPWGFSWLSFMKTALFLSAWLSSHICYSELLFSFENICPNYYNCCIPQLKCIK